MEFDGFYTNFKKVRVLTHGFRYKIPTKHDRSKTKVVLNLCKNLWHLCVNLILEVKFWDNHKIPLGLAFLNEVCLFCAFNITED